MQLEQWIERWNIPPIAFLELQEMFGIRLTNTTPTTSIQSEAHMQNIIRKEASDKGCRLWRNNVGATTTNTGSYIRFGLANDSPEMNSIIKSSDLIGIRPVVITEDLVGKKIGQFLCREVKKPGWKFDAREKRDTAQLRWIQLIQSLGGDASFAAQEGTI